MHNFFLFLGLDRLDRAGVRPDHPKPLLNFEPKWLIFEDDFSRNILFLQNLLKARGSLRFEPGVAGSAIACRKGVILTGLLSAGLV